jgi:MoaA/NifB/PqqE/SkfB family radical SAM enzyme
MLGERWVYRRAFAHHEGGYQLLFEDAAGGRSVAHLEVRERDDSRPAWRRSNHLDFIERIPEGEHRMADLSALERFLAPLIAADGVETQVTFPPRSRRVRPATKREAVLDPPEGWRAEGPSPHGERRVFVLTPETDCGLNCSFCSVRSEVSPVQEARRADTDRMLDALRVARQAGMSTIRFSGFDPLAHPDILELAEASRDAGYERALVYSPSPRLSDADFLSALVRALPEECVFHVPLYGASADVHDAVMGQPGSYAAILQGLGNLRELGVLDRVVLVTVLLPENRAELPALRRVFQEWGAPVQVFLPWPASRDPADRYFDVAIRHEELIGDVMASDPPLGVSAILPCVRFRFERDTGAPALSEGGFMDTPALPATLFSRGDHHREHDGPFSPEYTTPTTACPHAAGCALAHVCPKEVYTAYADTFGLEELQPVRLWDLRTL